MKMLCIFSVLDFNCSLKSSSQMLYICIDCSTDYVFSSLMALTVSQLISDYTKHCLYFLWTSSVNSLLKHLACLSNTHSRRYKDFKRKKKKKITGGSKSLLSRLLVIVYLY